MDSEHGIRVTSLARRDPPALGSVTLTGRLESDDAGVVYAGEHEGQQVVVVLLGEGAETDSYGRRRFHEAFLELDASNGETVVQFDDDVDIAPWVAVRADSWGEGLDLARDLLAPVTLAHLQPVGEVHGPDFRPHWFRRDGAGRWRLWPLPWPQRLTAGAWWTWLAAFALILAIAALALWIAIKIFEDSPAPQPGPGPAPGPNPPPRSSNPTPSTTGPTTSTPGPSPDTTGPRITASSIPPIV